MRTIRAAVLVTVTALIGSCGAPEASLPNPDHNEASKGIARIVRALQTGPSKIMVPPTEPKQCTTGTINGETVRSCQICAITIYRDGGHRQIGTARREVFNVAFKRGLSFEQPDVTPTNGQGVWVSVIPTGGLQGEEQMSRSLNGETGVGMFGGTFHRGTYGDSFYYGPDRYKREPGEVFQVLMGMGRERFEELVGPCP